MSISKKKLKEIIFKKKIWKIINVINSVDMCGSIIKYLDDSTRISMYGVNKFLNSMIKQPKYIPFSLKLDIKFFEGNFHNNFFVTSCFNNLNDVKKKLTPQFLRKYCICDKFCDENCIICSKYNFFRASHGTLCNSFASKGFTILREGSRSYIFITYPSPKPAIKHPYSVVYKNSNKKIFKHMRNYNKR